MKNFREIASHCREDLSMSSKVWYLLSGLFQLFGGLLALVFITLLFQIFETNSTNNYTMYTPQQSPGLHSLWWLLLNMVGILGSVLILIGLPAVYTYRAKQAGCLGLIGLILTSCAILLTGVFGVVLNYSGIWFLDNDAANFLAGNGPVWSDWLFIVDSAIFSAGAILLGLALIRKDTTSEFTVANIRVVQWGSKTQTVQTDINSGFVGAGVLFIIAGLLNIVHLLPITSDPFWGLDLTGSIVEMVAFCTGLVAFGFTLVSQSGAGPMVKRPLLYGTLTVSVVMGYVLVVGSIGVLVQQTRVAFVISLVVIGLIAILFQPLRDRLQRAVNRLVYGERDDPYAVLSQLGKHMQATVAPESVLPTIVETIARSLKLPYAAIVLKQEDELSVVAAYGSPTEQEQRFPLVYQTNQLGELVLSPRSQGEPLTPADQRLLHDLTPQIGVAVNAVRLTVDLQRSRERLVTTREEERRRLRRDLHDGLGPQLASQTLTLTAARKLLHENPDAADALLADATVHVQEAITDIRRLVYDLRPPALDDLGLIAALREQIAQYQSSGISFTLDVPDQLPELSAAVEVACYRIIQEALTNVVRHAHARICMIHIALNGVLILEITDDGTGLTAECRPGVGFSSMRERAEELGGSCTIESRPAPAGGTRVYTQLPLS
jgi:signal transduction histidine kinase